MQARFHSTVGQAVSPARILTALVSLLILFVPVVYAAEKDQSLEYQVKAAFLLNFTRFIDWPATEPAGAPFTICILGHDPFSRTLDRIVQGETVAGRKLVVQRIRRDPGQSCQIVFADRTEKDLTSLLRGLGSGVLTVGEGDSFLRDGGMVAFVIENRRMRFDINQSAATAAGLKISSKLLNVARSVEK